MVTQHNLTKNFVHRSYKQSQQNINYTKTLICNEYADIYVPFRYSVHPKNHRKDG